MTDQARLSGEKRPRRTSTFRLRRAELRIKGEIVPKLVAYQVMIDPAKALEFDKKKLEVQGQEPAPTTPGSVSADQPNGSTSIMQDFFITFLSDYADVSIGQFKIPVSWEGYGGSSKLLFPERALVSRRFGDRRDLGLRVEKKLGEHFFYSAGVFNGDGQNRADSNNQKDLALRLEGYPIKEVMLGVVGYTSVGQRDQPTTKDRVEGDARVELGNFVVQAEYIRGWDGPANAARTKGHGFYTALGYTLMDRIQPVVRVGFLAPNTEGNATGKDDEVWAYEADLNYFIQKYEAKLQLSYTLFDFDELKKRTEVILAAQASF